MNTMQTSSAPRHFDASPTGRCDVASHGRHPSRWLLALTLLLTFMATSHALAQGRHGPPRGRQSEEAASEADERDEADEAAQGHSKKKASKQDDSGQAPLHLDLNKATAAELEQLPGIGPAKAQAIVALRERRGNFRRVSEIMRVKGIGRATYLKLAPMLFVTEGPSGAHSEKQGRRRKDQAGSEPTER